MKRNGCGLAAIATLLSGYGYDYTPEDLRKIYVNFEGEHLEGDQMSSELTNRFGIANTDFLYASLYFEKEYVMEQLSKNKQYLYVYGIHQIVMDNIITLYVTFSNR